MTKHIEIIQLIVGYSFAAVLAFTALITAASLIGWIKFSDEKQQRKLFNVFIVEIVVLGLGFFSGLLTFDATKTADQILAKHELISVEAPANYAVYTNTTASMGFAYPENYIPEMKGSQIHHARIQLENDDKPIGWLEVSTLIPTDSERKIREEQGKASSYYLQRHVDNVKRNMPWIDPENVFIKQEEYTNPAGAGRLIAFEKEAGGERIETTIIFIYSQNHMIHIFSVAASKKNINEALSKTRNIVATLVVK